MQIEIPGHISESKLARMLGLSIPALRAWRKRGYGPAFAKFGRLIFYPEQDVHAFFASQRRLPGKED